MHLSFANDTIDVIPPVWVTDARNNRNATFPPDAPRTPVPGCSVQPGATSEVLDGRDTTAVRWTVFAPADAPVESVDAVEWQGVRYAVDGHPARHRSPTGTASHTVILLVDWK